MAEYQVTYFYLATGMEGVPDTHDYGVVEASSKDEAKDIVAHRIVQCNDEAAREFVKGCLTATLIDNQGENK